jgi:hypothetical protein
MPDTCTNPEFNSVLNFSAGDKFIMTLTLPSILNKYAEVDPRLNIESLQMSIFGTVVPQINVPAVEVRYGGQSTNFSTHSRPNYEPLSISFLIDNQYTNYYVLWRWLDLLNSATQSRYKGSHLNARESQIIGNLSEYQTTLNILALDEYNIPVIIFRYTNAFITNLGGLNYSYREGKTIESSAQFAFGQLDVTTEKNMSILDK